MVGSEIEYLYHFLCSRAVTYFFKTFYAGGGLGNSGYRYKKVFLEKLPIPRNTKKLKINKENVNEVVYKLYELNDDEIRFINSL